MLQPQGRRPLRAHRRHPNRGRRRPFPCPPEPPGVASPRLGQPLRRVGSRTDRRRSLTKAPGPPSARWRPRRGARLRRRRERVGSLRRRDESLTQGYYYHPSRHSAGQPIVAGWAYQFVAQLGFARESWTALVDVERLRPAQDANVVAAEQVEALLGRLEEGLVPLFPCSSSTRATTLSSCSEGSREARARSSSVCERGAVSTVRPEPLGSARTRRTPSSPRTEDEVR
jgi:hypothetical protein